jgi:hypothetical protein
MLLIAWGCSQFDESPAAPGPDGGIPHDAEMPADSGPMRCSRVSFQDEFERTETNVQGPWNVLFPSVKHQLSLDTSVTDAGKSLRADFVAKDAGDNPGFLAKWLADNGDCVEAEVSLRARGLLSDDAVVILTLDAVPTEAGPASTGLQVRALPSTLELWETDFRTNLFQLLDSASFSADTWTRVAVRLQTSPTLTIAWRVDGLTRTTLPSKVAHAPAYVVKLGEVYVPPGRTGSVWFDDFILR